MFLWVPWCHGQVVSGETHKKMTRGIKDMQRSCKKSQCTRSHFEQYREFLVSRVKAVLNYRATSSRTSTKMTKNYES